MMKRLRRIFYERLIRFTVEIVWIDEQMDFHSEFLEIIKIDDTNWENKELSKDRGIFDKEMESRFGKSLIVREACYTHRCGGWPWDDVVCATSRENPYPTTPSATQRRSSFARATLPYESLPCFSTPAHAVPDSTRNWRNLSQPRYSTYGVDRSAARFRKPLNSRLFFPFPRCSLDGPT